MRIVVLAGGLSTERDVSISSGIKVASALREKGHEVVLLDVFMGYEENFCDIDALFKNNYSFTDSLAVGTEVPDLKAVKEERLDKSARFVGVNVIEICSEADITYLALHGGEGENGQVQATLDLFGIKYTGSGYLGSALAMDKALTKSVLIQNSVTTAQGKVYSSKESAESWDCFPCVVKPCSGGSSVGIAKANNKTEYLKAVEDAFGYEKQIVVEQFIEGREFSVGVIGGRALPPIEIISKTGFYDYVAKYQDGITDHICPADITEQEDEVLRCAAEAAFEALRLQSYARIDFILDKSGVAYCLEANSLPGMTPTSLLPLEAAAEGVDYPSLCEKIIEVSLKKYN